MTKQEIKKYEAEWYEFNQRTLDEEEGEYEVTVYYDGMYLGTFCGTLEDLTPADLEQMADTLLHGNYRGE